jgi:hypothetical protein
MELYWVPRHVGARGDETVDQLTRNGSASGFGGRSQAWGSLGRISGIRLVAGWGTSIGGAGRILATPNCRLVH